MGRAPAILLLPALGACSSVQAVGYAAADGRAFVQAPRYQPQSGAPGISLAAEPELHFRSPDGTHLLTLRPFLRVDSLDTRRTHADLRRADYVLSLGSWELAAGVGQFRWGVLESHRVVDALSPVDQVEDLAQTAKLGQLYAAVAWQPGADEGSDWQLRAIVLPHTRTPAFPGPRGRLRFASVVSDQEAIFETALGPWQPSAALRASGSIGEVDLALGLFSGVSREPRFIAQLTAPEVVAAFDRSHQASFELMWTHGGFAWKLELMTRLWSEALQPIFAGGTGLEYTLADLAGTDLTLVGELFLDTRPNEAPVSFFEHDAFLGVRWALHDEGDTVLTVGGVQDLTVFRAYLRVEATHRFGEHWKLSLQLHGFFGEEGALESSLLQDHHGQVRLAYHF
jgi:hypothetical protein